MIIDAREVQDGTQLQADVCIVGSGVAATALALHLRNAVTSVVLLEAGGPRSDRPGDPGPDILDGVDHEPPDRVSPRRLGGALAVWGGRLAPLDPEDMVPRPGRDGSWPLDHDQLSRWYPDAHRWLRAGRHEYRPERALGSAEPMLLPRGGSSDLTERLWRWSPPLRFRHVRDELAASLRIRLYHHALVTELCQDADGRTVHAVVATAGARRLSVRARVFVVAGGGLQSARLLLASRRPGRDRGLGDEHDQVGRNYMTHPVADVGPLLVAPSLSARLCSFQHTVDGVYARRFLALRPSVRAAEGLLNINLATWGPDPHDPSHGDGLLSAYALTKHFLMASGLTAKTSGTHRFNGGHPLNLPAHVRNIGSTVPGTVRQAASWSRRRWLADRQVPAVLNPGRRGVLRVRFDAEQRPHPDNRVQLLRERDADGMPRLDVSYQVRHDDRASYYRSLELLQGELARQRAGVLQLPPKDEFMDTLPMGNGTHQLGLLRMSATPSEGVVDPQLRVHSSPNTYVLSTGVFPTAGAAPPTLTLVALAQRLAERLSRRN